MTARPVRELLLLAAFALELWGLLAVGIAGSRIADGPLAWACAAALVLTFALVWGVWSAPRSPRRLSGSALVGFQLAWFGAAALALAASGSVLHAGLLLACAASVTLAIAALGIDAPAPPA